MPIKKRFVQTMKQLLEKQWQSPGVQHPSELVAWGGDDSELKPFATKKIIPELIEDVYGERCDDYDPDCQTCKVWREYDTIRTIKLTVSKVRRPKRKAPPDE